MLNKKMREILEKQKGLVALAAAETDLEKAAEMMDQCDELQKQLELEQRMLAYAQSEVPEEPEAPGKKELSGFEVLAKLFRGEPWSAEEKAMVEVRSDIKKALQTGQNSANGENYLIPEDIRTEINELRRRYMSAKTLLTNIPVSTLSGRFTFEAGAPTGLISFIDGDDVPNGAEPDFEGVSWEIGLKGALIPVSNILTDVERAGLMAYLNRWFIRNAIISENIDIFTTLKDGKAPKDLTSLADLTTSLIVDVDMALRSDMKIVTNQSGLANLANVRDGNGRPMLEPDPTNPTARVFNGYPVVEFPNSHLPDVGGKHPIFYGDTESGAFFIELRMLFMAVSAHAGFRRNQTLMRVIEGYDVIQADKDAYVYGLFLFDEDIGA